MHPWQRSALPAVDPITRLYIQSPFVDRKSGHTSLPVPSAIHEDVRDLSMVDNQTAGCRMVPVEVDTFFDFYERRR